MNIMNNFTLVINEARKNFDSESILQSEVTRFLSKISKDIPVVVKNVIHLTQKYNLMDKLSIEEIRKSTKSSLKLLAKKYNIGLDEIENLWKQLKELDNKIYLLPQYMTPYEREMIDSGKLTLDDLCVDVSDSKGRSMVTKMYMPMIYKIVNQWVGKSSLSKMELMSAALEGFTLAMNEWDRSKNVPFKTYAGTRVRQKILNDMDKYSHTLSGTSWYSTKMGSNVDAMSLDNMLFNGDEIDQDRLVMLGTTDDDITRLDDDKFKLLYDLLERKFKQRDIVIFYRYFGLNGYQKVKSKELAKEFGWSESNIRNTIINKIIKYLRENPKAKEILSDIQESYDISIMIGLVGMDREMIMESLCDDDIFILLEELNRWNDENLFLNNLDKSLNSLSDKEQKYIISVLSQDFSFLDGSYKKNKKTIVQFLDNMYPTEAMNKKTDVSLLEYMEELQEYYQKYKK